MQLQGWSLGKIPYFDPFCIVFRQHFKGMQKLKMELCVCESVRFVSKGFCGSKGASPAQTSEVAKEAWLSRD